MKKVILTYTMDFEDDVDDDTCVQITLDIMRQDGHWPNDGQIQIEHLPDGDTRENS